MLGWHLVDCADGGVEALLLEEHGDLAVAPIHVAKVPEVLAQHLPAAVAQQRPGFGVAWHDSLAEIVRQALNWERRLHNGSAD